MHSLLRQVFVAILGGVVAAGVMLAVNHYRPGPNIALAQTSITEVPANSPAGADAPNVDAQKMINYQGQVFNPNTGQLYTSASLNMTFSFWDAATGGNQLYTEDRYIQTNADGFFSTNLGDTTNFNKGNTTTYSLFNGDARYLQVTILGQVLGPRQPLTFVPFAMWAYHAKHLGDYEEDDFPKIVAYGVVNADGGRDSDASGDNFDSSRGDVAGSTVYIIDIDDIDHSINDFTTIVTPACGAPVMTGVGSSNGDLVVDVFDPNGSRTTCRFEFMVLKK